MSAKTITLFDRCFKIENRTSTPTIFQKTDTWKLLCLFLSSFSAKDYLKIAWQCKQTYAIFLRFGGIILRLIWNHVKNHEKEHSGHDWNNSFFYFYFTTFLIIDVYAFLQQFIAGKTFKVASNSTSHRRILATLQKSLFICELEDSNKMLIPLRMN